MGGLTVIVLSQFVELTRPALFSKRETVGCDAKRAPATGSRPNNSLWIGSSASRSASLPWGCPQAMPKTRWPPAINQTPGKRDGRRREPPDLLQIGPVDGDSLLDASQRGRRIQRQLGLAVMHIMYDGVCFTITRNHKNITSTSPPYGMCYDSSMPSVKIVPVSFPTTSGVLWAGILGLVLPTGVATMDTLTNAFVTHLWLRAVLFALAGIGARTVYVNIRPAPKWFLEHLRFRRLHGPIAELRKLLSEGQVTGVVQDKFADLLAELYLLGVLRQESLPPLTNVDHLRTSLAALDNRVRRWALADARDTKWQTAFARTQEDDN